MQSTGKNNRKRRGRKRDTAREVTGRESEFPTAGHYGSVNNSQDRTRRRPGARNFNSVGTAGKQLSETSFVSSWMLQQEVES